MDVEHEVEIVWEVDVTGLTYVREAQVRHCRTRQGPVAWTGGQRVGYSVLAPDAPSDGAGSGFTRRVFFLTEADPYAEWPWVPVEAVDPQSVVAGLRSRALGAADVNDQRTGARQVE